MRSSASSDAVARHLRADHAIGLGVVGDDADVQIVLVAKQRDLGPLGGRAARVGLALDELANLRRGAPGRLVQRAIDFYRAADGSDVGRPDDDRPRFLAQRRPWR